MQTELQVSLGSESHLHPENISVQDRDPDVTLSTANRVLTNDPGMLVFVYDLLDWRFRECDTYTGRKTQLQLLHNIQCSKKTNKTMGCLDTS